MILNHKLLYYLIVFIISVNYTNLALGNTLLYAPVGVTVTASSGQNIINWIPVQGATSYNIYWSQNPNVTKLNSTVIQNITPPFIHKNLDINTFYYYKVTALTKNSESTSSAEIKSGYFMTSNPVTQNTVTKPKIHNKAYITNYKDNSVSVIDLNTNTIISTIITGNNPFGIAANPMTNKIYVVNSESKSVSVIDSNTDTLITTIPIEITQGTSIDINSSTNLAYVTSYTDNNVTVLDISTNKVIQTIAVGPRPVGITVNKDNNTIYVTDWLSDVYILNGTKNNLLTIDKAGTRTYDIALHPTNNNLIYVTNIEGNSVSLLNISTHTIIKDINVGIRPSGIKINSITNKAYIANSVSNTVTVIDIINNSIVTTIPVGKNPQEIGINTLTNMIYIINAGSNSISVIDSNTDKIINTIENVGNNPYDIAII